MLHNENRVGSFTISSYSHVSIYCPNETHRSMHHTWAKRCFTTHVSVSTCYMTTSISPVYPLARQLARVWMSSVCPMCPECYIVAKVGVCNIYVECRLYNYMLIPTYPIMHIHMPTEHIQVQRQIRLQYTSAKQLAFAEVRSDRMRPKWEGFNFSTPWLPKHTLLFAIVCDCLRRRLVDQSSGTTMLSRNPEKSCGALGGSA